MTTLLVITTFAFAIPAAQSRAVENTRTAPSARVSVDRASPKRCPSAQRAVKFYAGRIAYWRSRLGVRVKPPAATACPRYLAHVLQRKSYASRRAFERWWKDRGQIISRLDRGLQGSPMAGTGVILERWGRRFHVSPFFMAAAAATESSLGAAACSNNHYNVWGLSSCGSGWNVPSFRSWDEAIAFYARFLASRWPSHQTPYSFTGYAACDSCWGNTVSRWMHSLFGVAAVTRYP